MKTRACGLWLVVLVGLSCQQRPIAEPDGGAADAGQTLPAPTVLVDSSVVPRQPGSAERPVAAFVGEGGAQVEVVANELLISTDDEAALQAFVREHQATVIKTMRFAEVGLEMPALYHLRVGTLEAVDGNTLPLDLARLKPGVTDALRVSDANTVRLLALAAHTTKPGFVVNVNSLIVPQGIVERTSYEAAERTPSLWDSSFGAPYNANAFTWPYMSDEGQKIGVGAAWEYLAAAGLLSPRVRLLVLDGGFRQHDDLPASTVMLSTWNIPNAAKCAGSACPWHGTEVASAAASLIDNGRGTAGTGGPVVKLYLGQVWGEINDVGDFFGRVLETFKTLVTLSGALGSAEPLIVNISASLDLPSLADPIVSAAWGVLTGALRAKGVMIIAAAGNDGQNVDRERCYGPFCFEPVLTIPCELGNVYCIGGVQSTSLRRHPNSAWGSDGDVDLFAPFLVWTVDPEAIVNGEARKATLSAGTSMSAPFVAGIAALVRAARPTWSPGEVERALTESATPSPDPEVRRVVNAGEAVRRALGVVSPRIFDWPRSVLQRSLNQPLEVSLNVTNPFKPVDANIRAYAGSSEPLTLTVASTGQGDHTEGATVTFGSLGVRTITATVTNSNGSDSRSFDVEVKLSDGRLFATFGSGSAREGQPLYGAARGYDRVGLVGDPDSTFVNAPCSRVRWTVPLVRGPIGSYPVGTVVTEIDTSPVVLGQPRGFARGCHAQLALPQGTHEVKVDLLGTDNATVIATRVLTVYVDARVDAVGPELGLLAVSGTTGNTVAVDPSELDFYVTGVFVTARYLQTQYADPGTQQIEGLRFTVHSLVNAQTLELAIDPNDQAHAEEGQLPSADSALTPWPGMWLAPEPEPSMIVLNASVTDNGLTASRPTLVRLKRRAIVK